jgi:hypothetical protein
LLAAASTLNPLNPLIRGRILLFPATALWAGRRRRRRRRRRRSQGQIVVIVEHRDLIVCRIPFGPDGRKEDGPFFRC